MTFFWLAHFRWTLFRPSLWSLTSWRVTLGLHGIELHVRIMSVGIVSVVRKLRCQFHAKNWIPKLQNYIALASFTPARYAGGCFSPKTPEFESQRPSWFFLTIVLWGTKMLFRKVNSLNWTAKTTVSAMRHLYTWALNGATPFWVSEGIKLKTLADLGADLGAAVHRGRVSSL